MKDCFVVSAGLWCAATALAQLALCLEVQFIDSREGFDILASASTRGLKFNFPQ